MYHHLLRQIVFPCMEFVKGTTIQRDLAFLEKSQWWKPGELRELQDERLRSLVRHAYSRVPYYRRIFRERGLSDQDIRTAEDLGKLPLLTKEDIRNHAPELLAVDYRNHRPFLNTTSGSTGEPLRYYTSLASISMLWASGFRGWGWAGYRLGERYMTLGGSSLVPNEMSLQKRARYLFERNLALTSLNMNEATVASYTDRIRKYSPRFIRGYPSAIFSLAHYLREHGGSPITPVAIFTTAETLLPPQRSLIEEVFQSRIFDEYGCRDGGAAAMECGEHAGYHLCPEQSVLELVQDGERVPDGSLGEIVSTDLCNYAMPFIRYRTGDTAIGTGERCACGRGLPLFKSIQGRIINMVRHEDGSVISGLPLTDVFEHIAMKQRDSIRRYQLIQERQGHLDVRIVRGKNYLPEYSEQIVLAVKEHMGKNTQVHLDFPDDIPATKTGKQLFVISKVAR